MPVLRVLDEARLDKYLCQSTAAGITQQLIEVNRIKYNCCSFGFLCCPYLRLEELHIPGAA